MEEIFYFIATGRWLLDKEWQSTILKEPKGDSLNELQTDVNFGTAWKRIIYQIEYDETNLNNITDEEINEELLSRSLAASIESMPKFDYEVYDFHKQLLLQDGYGPGIDISDGNPYLVMVDFFSESAVRERMCEVTSHDDLTHDTASSKRSRPFVKSKKRLMPKPALTSPRELISFHGITGEQQYRTLIPELETVRIKIVPSYIGAFVHAKRNSAYVTAAILCSALYKNRFHIDQIKGLMRVSGKSRRTILRNLRQIVELGFATEVSTGTYWTLKSQWLRTDRGVTIPQNLIYVSLGDLLAKKTRLLSAYVNIFKPSFYWSRDNSKRKIGGGTDGFKFAGRRNGGHVYSAGSDHRSTDGLASRLHMYPMAYVEREIRTFDISASFASACSRTPWLSERTHGLLLRELAINNMVTKVTKKNKVGRISVSEYKSLGLENPLVRYRYKMAYRCFFVYSKESKDYIRYEFATNKFGTMEKYQVKPEKYKASKLKAKRKERRLTDKQRKTKEYRDRYNAKYLSFIRATPRELSYPLWEDGKIVEPNFITELRIIPKSKKKKA